MAGGAAMAVAAFTPQRLVNGLGGNTVVQGVYDDWFQTTVSAGSVSSWGDFRGSGFGPALPAFSTGTKPTQASGIGSPIVFAASGTVLGQASASSLFFPGVNVTLVYIGGTTYAGSSGNGSTAVLSGISGADTDCYVGINTTPHWCANVGSADTVVDSGVASSSTVRTVLVGAAGTSSGYARVVNQGEVTGTINVTDNTTTQLVVGGYKLATNVSNPQQVHAVVVTNQALGANAPAIAYLALYGNRRHGAVND